MIIRNKVLQSIIWQFIKHKERKLSFSFEQGLVDDEVVDQALVRQYITALQTAVDEEIEQLSKEYDL